MLTFVMYLHAFSSAVFLVLFSSVLTLSKALQCDDNMTCRNNECTDEGECLSGCGDGFVLDTIGKCVVLCPNTCKHCLDGLCGDCKTGYYGHQCSTACGGCQHDVCDMDTGQCSNGCKLGFYDDPWCNTTSINIDADDDHDHHHHQENHAKAKISKHKAEELTKLIYIWIAAAMIIFVVVAAFAIVVLVVCQREHETKSSALTVSGRLRAGEEDPIELEEVNLLQHLPKT